MCQTRYQARLPGADPDFYGTILVDLEKRRPIELLPDRKEKTLTAWLLTHPEIEVVSRDRGGEYAAAARKGAPQARAYC